MATLYMLFGYPGAGKTTTAKVLHELTGATHLSSDHLRSALFQEPTFTQAEHDEVYHQLDKTAEHLLATGHDVIYDANLNRLQHREEKYVICQRTGAKPLLLWLTTSREMAKSRASDSSRQHLWPPNVTPDQLFERVARAIEEPGPDEPYIVLDGTKVTKDYIRGQLGL